MEEVARLVQALTPQDRQALAFLDMQVRARENASWEGVEPTYGVLNCLRYWEILIRRMEDEWVRQDYYFADEYLNVLTSRDRVEDFLEVMPAGLRAKTTRCVDRLDARFRNLTFEDRGAELSKYWYPLAEGREIRWWWTRRPIDLPPGW